MAKETKKAQSGLTPEALLGILIIIVLLIPIAFYYMFYSDKSDEATRRERNIVQLENEIIAKKERETQLLVIREESKRMEARLSVLRAKIPSSSDELNFFLESVSQRARASKIYKWTLFKQEGLIARDEVSVVPIRMEFLSTYEAAAQFFWELASMGDGIKSSNRDQIINIRDLDISRQGNTNANEAGALLRISCVAETYLYTGQRLDESQRSR